MKLTSLNRVLENQKTEYTHIAQCPPYVQNAVRTLAHIYAYENNVDIDIEDYINEKIWCTEELIDTFVENGNLPCLDENGNLHFVNC